MPRLLVIPAAGMGSRLGTTVPKVLVRVAGETMLDRLLALYRGSVDHVVVVVNPAFSDRVREHIAHRGDAGRIDCIEQPSPTGMLDAILLAAPVAAERRPSSIWVTWCDQIAVHPKTILRLAQLTSAHAHDALVMPTVRQQRPYIHLQRDATGRIVRVLHRREGDVMPDVGESDMGLFALSATSYSDRLPEYARSVEIGRATGERNFLPFIPWLARTETVTTFPAESEMEAVGVNTPEELAMVERYLASGQAADPHVS
jgi:bifunctional UDP-N-acetylglucosamine pyrophosphorylase / glucosamine-1-phosphate N-acetyltransferase